MDSTFAARVGKDYYPHPNEPVFDSLLHRYEQVIFESLITAFGLDFIKDQHGGDVDTIHTAREIGRDPLMTYKNKENEAIYNGRPEYDKSSYHERNDSYQAVQRQTKEADKAAGRPVPIKDEYTGEDIYRLGKSKNAPSDLKAELDHVLSAKTIHEDRGRVLAGLKGEDLANSPENLRYTNKSLNASMGATKDEQGNPVDIPTYINLHPELDETTKRNMMKAHEEAQKAYEAKVSTAYYTGERFRKDLHDAAVTRGKQMMLRQAAGFVFAEIWFSVKEEFDNAERPFDIGKFLKKIPNAIKQGVVRAKEKFPELCSRLGEGFFSGYLSSVTTTLCNIFFTTAKNVVKVIREAYASIVRAGTILLFNPDDLFFGDRIKLAAVTLSTGASVVLGSLVRDAISKTPVGTIPGLSKVVPAFCGALVSGILSCTFLFFLDSSTAINKVISAMNELQDIEHDIAYYKHEAEYFSKLAAEFEKIDWKALEHEIGIYERVAARIECASEKELKSILLEIHSSAGIKLPWQGEFDEFMSNRNNRLVFQ